MRETSKNRRRTALAASVLALALAATACGSSDSSAGGDTATGSSTYVFALPQDFQGVDRAAYSSEASKTIGDVMHGRLLELDTDASSPTACKTDVPAAIGSSSALVDSWSVTPDGLGIDITLKPDVKSADGNVLTSDDVAWTIERAKAIDTGAQTLFFKVGGYDPDNTMTITSPTQFRFNLTAPNALAPYVLSSNIGLVLDSTTLKQKTTPDDPWAKTYLTDHTANFGPWQLSTFGPQQLTFAKNDNFAGERGNIDQIVLRTVSDASSRIQLIQSGQISETIGLDYTQLEQLGAASSVNIVECASPARDWLGLNSGDPVLGKPEVRRAISLALDRSAISDAVYRGFAEPAGHGLSNAFSPTSGDENYTQDQSKARELLAAAGVPDGFGFDLSVSAAQPGPYSSNLAVLIQQQLAAVGITVNIVNVPSAVQFRSDGLAKSMQAWLLAETPAFANPGYSGWLTAGTAGLQNYMGYSNPEVDAITAGLMADPTGPDSAAAQARLSDIIATDQPAVYLVDRPTIAVRSSCATQVPASAFGADYTQAVTSCR